MDGCYGPLYPAAGDASMCFIPDLPMSTSPPVVTSAGQYSTLLCYSLTITACS